MSAKVLGPVAKFVADQKRIWAQPAAARAADPVTREVADGNGQLLPHYRTFSGLVNTFSRVHSYRHDEALRAGRENARAMRRDAYLRALEQERVLPLTRWQWKVEIDPDDVPTTVGPTNPKDPGSADREKVRGLLEAIARRTYELHQMRQYLGTAIWFGRYGSQLRWDRQSVGGFPRLVVGYAEPVHGDKILHTYDGVPGVMIYGGDKGKYPDVRPTDAGGMLAVLSRPDMRRRFIIAKHVVEDADFFEAEAAGRVNGVGLRDFCYWAWWLRDEMISWLVDFMEKVGNLGLMIFYYEENNAASKSAAELAAKNSSGKNALAVPVPKGKDASTARVELLPANTSGAEFLKGVVSDYFERHIERLFVGQSMSGGADDESGLGGTGRADFAQNTKHNLLCWDAENQAATFTTDLILPAQHLNFPGLPWRYRWAYSLPDPAAKDRLDAVQKLMQFLPFKADDIYKDIGYTRPDPGDETVGGPQAMPGMGGPGMPPGAAGPEGGPPVPGSDPAGGGDPQDAGPVPGMAEVVAAMFRAAADGDKGAVDKLVRLGQNKDELAGLLDDAGGDAEPKAGAVAYQKGGAGASPPAKFGSTQIDLTGEARDRLLAIAASIPDADLADDGREGEPHITVKYGLHTDDPSDVYRAIHDFGPVSARLTTLGAFRAADTGRDYDVLFARVASNDLRRLNARLAAALDCTDTHPEYRPHATVAYLKPGLADKYVDQVAPLDIPVAADRLTFAGRDRTPHTILLTGRQHFAPRPSAAGTVNYEWTAARTANGHTKAVWAGAGTRPPLYGKRAEAALAAKTPHAAEEPGPHRPAAKAKELAAGREPARQAARAAYQKALADPGAVTAEELPALAEHLHALTRDEIRLAVQQQTGGTGWGKVKAELVDALVKYVRDGAAHEAIGRDEALKPKADTALEPDDGDAAKDKADRMGRWAADRPESVAAEDAARAAGGRVAALKTGGEPAAGRSKGPKSEAGKPAAAKEPHEMTRAEHAAWAESLAAGVEPRAEVNAHEIEPVNDTSYKKVKDIAAAMKEHGWQGPPLLVVPNAADGYDALTGSHRQAAANKVGVRVPVIVLDPKKYREAAKAAGVSPDPRESNNEEKLALLEKYGDADALKVIRREFESTPDAHQLAVIVAAKSGKTVPPEVLAEYPDLAAKSPTPKADTPAAPASPPVDPADHAAFAAAVHAAGAKLNSVYGHAPDSGDSRGVHKVLISDLYDAMRGTLPPGTTLDQFKSAVVANQTAGGGLLLSRLDMPHVLERQGRTGEWERSRAEHPLGATFNNVDVPASHLPAAAPRSAAESAPAVPLPPVPPVPPPVRAKPAPAGPLHGRTAVPGGQPRTLTRSAGAVGDVIRGSSGQRYVVTAAEPDGGRVRVTAHPVHDTPEERAADRPAPQTPPAPPPKPAGPKLPAAEAVNRVKGAWENARTITAEQLEEALTHLDGLGPKDFAAVAAHVLATHTLKSVKGRPAKVEALKHLIRKRRGKFLRSDYQSEAPPPPKFADPVNYGLDAAGHKHKGKGPDGGQFTGDGSGGKSAGKAKPAAPKANNKSGPATAGDSERTPEKPGKTGQKNTTSDTKKDAEPAPNGDNGVAETVTPEVHKAAQAKAIATADAATVPTAEEVAKNNAGMTKLGADRFEANVRGNSKDRASSRARLLKDFGDGTTCPCVYCGLKLDDTTVQRDKIFTARRGGKYRQNNLVPCCSACNKNRSDKPFAAYMATRKVG